MPMYYRLCRECNSEVEVLESYDTFMLNNTTESATMCKHCGKTASILSLSKLVLQSTDGNVSNFYPSGTTEKFFRGLMGVGQKD